MSQSEGLPTTGGPLDRPPPRTRLIVFYAVLAAATAVIALLVLAAGDDEKAQPSIAGGYDTAASNDCLGSASEPLVNPKLPKTAPAQPKPAGPPFDLKQSGRFVNLSNTKETLDGQLELATSAAPDGKRRLSGDVTCIDGEDVKLEATATPGAQTKLEGEVGQQPFEADLKRDPPDPGAAAPRVPSSIAGKYKLSPRSTCFGGLFELSGGGSRYDIEAKSKALGSIQYDKKTGALGGTPKCARGGTVRMTGLAVDRNLNNVQLIPLQKAKPANAAANLTTPSGLAPGGEKFTATKQRDSFGKTVAAFFLAVVVVMLVARLFGNLAVRIAQPRVMGEVVAGISLGPTIFGAIAPELQANVFPTDILPAFGTAANLGLIFYIFLVGLEFDPGQLTGRVGQAAAISNASVALPMMLGLVVALPLYEALAPDTKFAAFALFMGVAMSITAFPVLARILVERRMLRRPIGALTLACAAIDDVTAWFLIALATAIAVAGDAGEVVKTILLAIAFCLGMALLVRPAIGRVSSVYDQAGRVPGGWIAAIFAGVLLSAFLTEEIGIAVIFGAFIMGMVMPRNAGLTEDVTHRLEDIVVILLLPLFFAYTGLKTNVGLLDRPVLWLVTLLLIAVAIVGKFGGAIIASRLTGFGWRPAAVIGTLMNTRGLTELIVLNLALELGVISDALYAMLVLMALVTTLMAGPLLRVLDRKGEFSEPPEEELEEARRRSAADFPALTIPERSILVAPQGETALVQLRQIAEPLARSEPPREVITARLVKPPLGVAARGGLQTENKLLEKATEETNSTRDELIEKSIAARAVAFISPDPGADLARLAQDDRVDLVLTDGQRPLLGEGVPRGEVGRLLETAPCDVAVLVAREDAALLPGPGAYVIVPFGGAEHDWAALELGAWISAATGAPLKLLGVAGQTDDRPRITRMLGDAGMLVQQSVGVAPEPILALPGKEEIVRVAEGAGLLVVGLSSRWRKEGLGATRSAIAKTSAAPVLFVRRGRRPGALAPHRDVTRFTWSSPGVTAEDSIIGETGR